MSKLKSTIKTREDYGKASGFNRTWGYVFSADLDDWQYPDTQMGRDRRRKAKQEQKHRKHDKEGTLQDCC